MNIFLRAEVALTVLLYLQLVWNGSAQLRWLPSPYLISALFCYCPKHTVDILHQCRMTTLTATRKKFHCLQKENFITPVKGTPNSQINFIGHIWRTNPFKTSDIHFSVMVPAELRIKFRPISQDYIIVGGNTVYKSKNPSQQFIKIVTWTNRPFNWNSLLFLKLH